MILGEWDNNVRDCRSSGNSHVKTSATCYFQNYLLFEILRIGVLQYQICVHLPRIGTLNSGKSYGNETQVSLRQRSSESPTLLSGENCATWGLQIILIQRILGGTERNPSTSSSRSRLDQMIIRWERGECWSLHINRKRRVYESSRMSSVLA